jgi:hypothetical protein
MLICDEVGWFSSLLLSCIPVLHHYVRTIKGNKPTPKAPITSHRRGGMTSTRNSIIYDKLHMNFMYQRGKALLVHGVWMYSTEKICELHYS